MLDLQLYLLCPTGSNSDLKGVMRQETEFAARRMQEHWNAVTAQQQLCSQLENQLPQLVDTLSNLEEKANEHHRVFTLALKEAERLRNESVLQYNQMTSAATPGERQQAEEYRKQAEEKFDLMMQEGKKTKGATSTEGKVCSPASVSRMPQMSKTRSDHAPVVRSFLPCSWGLSW